MFWTNPEFIRIRRTRLRLRSVLTLSAVALVIFGGVLVTMWFSFSNAGGFASLQEMLRAFFFTTVGIQLAVVSIYGVLLAAQNVTLEKERGTYDFQRLVGMGPFHLTLGKLFGCSCEAWCLTLVGMFFAILPAIGKAVPFHVCVEAELVVLLSGICSSAFGLMCSSIVSKTSQSTGVAVLIGGFMAIGGVVGAAGAGRNGNESTIWSSVNPVAILIHLGQEVYGRQAGGTGETFNLFGWDVPILAGFVLNNILYTILYFLISVRRIADEELSYIRPWHAAIVFSLLQLLLIGSLWASPASIASSGTPNVILQPYHFGNMILLIALAFAMTPSPELLKSRISRGKSNEHWTIFWERSSRLQDSPAMFHMACFASAYIVLALVLTFFCAKMDVRTFATVIMVASMGLAMEALLLYTQSFKSCVAILMIAMTVPPLIFGLSNQYSYSGVNRIPLVSPAAYIFDFHASRVPNEFLGVGEVWCCPLICAVLALSLSILAAMHIRFQLDVNETERLRELKLHAEAKEKGMAPEIAAARVLASVNVPAPAALVDTTQK